MIKYTYWTAVQALINNPTPGGFVIQINSEIVEAVDNLLQLEQDHLLDKAVKFAASELELTPLTVAAVIEVLVQLKRFTVTELVSARGEAGYELLFVATDSTLTLKEDELAAAIDLRQIRQQIEDRRSALKERQSQLDAARNDSKAQTKQAIREINTEVEKLEAKRAIKIKMAETLTSRLAYLNEGVLTLDGEIDTLYERRDQLMKELD